jgi:16S rRNA processing protein RimM
MIKREELIKIGQFRKPHGIKGEITFDFSNDAFDESDCPFLVCEIDGIFVPFRLDEYRFKSNSSALVKLNNIDSEAKAKPLTNKEVYFPKEQIDSTPSDDDYTWDYFIGFSLIDKQSGKIGTIVAVDDSTLNTLFIVKQHKGEILIPAHEEMIIRIDEEQKEIQVELPEGILDLE